MFGLGKLKEAKEQAEQLKAKLDATSFVGNSHDGKVEATVTGAKNVLEINIDDSIFKIRAREDVQKLVIEAVNDAMYKADEKIKEEMKGILPNIPGLGL